MEFVRKYAVDLISYDDSSIDFLQSFNSFVHFNQMKKYLKILSVLLNKVISRYNWKHVFKWWYCIEKILVFT